MTTDAGSVWDRGADDVDGAAIPSSNPPLPVPPPPALTAPDPSPAEIPPAETVWSRGPSPDAIAVDLPTVGRRVPEPVLPPAPPSAPRAGARPPVRRPAKVLAGALVVVLLAALAWSLGMVGGDESVPALATDTTAASLPLVSLSTVTEPTVTEPTVTEPTVPSTAPPATTLASTTTSTTSTSTTSTSTTTAPSTTSTTAPTAVSTAPAAVDPVGPHVTIVGRVGPCKFGHDCLIADFTISDFASPQREFVCEFENGSRYTFRFDGRGADQACASSAADATITIEVGGVRSEPITR